MSDLYYLQDSRSYVGNAMGWWGYNCSGYVCDVLKAGVYSKKEAMSQHRCRETDIPWKKEDIDAKLMLVADIQYFNREENRKALRLKKPTISKHIEPHVESCYYCANREDVYSCAKFPGRANLKTFPFMNWQRCFSDTLEI